MEHIKLVDIAERIKAGDEKAFTKLYEKYKRLMFREAQRVIGNCGYVEDIVNKAFTNFYRNIDNLKNPQGAVNYIKNSVINLCKNYLRDNVDDRKMIRFQELEKEDNPDYVDNIIPKKRIGTIVEIEEEMINQLPPKQYKTFTMHILGHTYKEISQATDCTVNAVYQNLSKARKTLKRLLEKKRRLSKVNKK